MSQAVQTVAWSVIAVFPDQESAERVVRRLHQAGYDMCDLSIVGRDVQLCEHPVALGTTSDYAQAGTEIGASLGTVVGVCAGTGLLLLPGLGPVIVAGPIVAAVAGAAEGAAAGAGLGALAGALVAWGVHKVHAPRYESAVEEGKFLVLARGDSQKIEQARSLLATETPEYLEVYRRSPRRRGQNESFEETVAFPGQHSHL